jgi:glycosyltransferase involved in cell wall biosynthesis
MQVKPSRKIFFFESHPVQYKAPVYQELQRLVPDAFEVVYASDCSIRPGSVDIEFGVEVMWDIPLLQGYQNRILRNERGEPLTSSTSLTGNGIHRLLLRERPAAVVLTHLRYRFDQVAYISALALGIPILVRQETQDEVNQHLHNGWKRLLRKFVYDIYYAPVRHAFAFGALNREHLVRHGIAERKISLARFSVPDPLVDMPEHRKRELFETIRSQLGIPDNSIVVGFFGKFIARKEPQLLFDALDHVDPDIRRRIHFLLVGTGDLEPTLRSMSIDTEAKYSVRSTFAGFVNQSRIHEYYLATDLAVLPSRMEAWGLVINEALQAGCAAIVSDGVGCRHEFADLERFRVFRHADAAQLGARITELARFERSFEWARARMADYSSAAAARGIARGITPFLEAH